MPHPQNNDNAPNPLPQSERPQKKPVGGFVPSRRDIVLLATALTTAALVGIAAGGRRTVTIDEFHHLPAGCFILRTGQLFMHPKSPPLARCLAALPAILLGADIPTENSWQEMAPGWGPWMYGTTFWMRNRGSYDRFFWWGRIMNLIWLFPLGFAVFYWAGDLYGRRAAWLSTLLLCASPSLLAHASLVTTDLAATSTWFTATYLAWRASTQSRGARLAGGTAGVFLGIGLLSKFSLVLLPGTWLATCCWAAISFVKWPPDWKTKGI